ncbi:uncharacterized protein ACB058_006687 [Synchiropus picturatus]
MDQTREPCVRVGAAKRPGRAHFFSAKEQTLIMKLFDEEKAILTAKSNTSSASRQREEAWKRIAERINAASDSGCKRSWQQVKNKYKNIVQSARRRRNEMMNHNSLSDAALLSSGEESRLQMRDDSLGLDVLPGAACMEAMTGSESSFIGTSGHPVLLLPVTKVEPESLSEAETDVSEAQYEGVFDQRGRESSAFAPPTGRGEEEPADNLRRLYCAYLKKEMENRDHEMAYRALKMRKLEKEILLLDRQLK